MKLAASCVPWVCLGLVSACASEGFESADVASEQSQLEIGDPLRRLGVARTETRIVGSVSALDSQNGLASGLFSRPKVLQELRTLAGKPLTSMSGRNTIARIAALADGPSLLAYLAVCALKPSDRLPVVASPGRLNLARDWLDRPLSAEGQGWVTACLLAHANNRAHVTIAVTGNHPALAGEGPAPAVGAHFEEAAFYGNAFLGAELGGQQSGKPYLFACSGAHAASRCEDRGLAQDFRLRVCGSSSVCGFEFTGACLSIETPPGPEACQPELPYASCGEESLPPGSARVPLHGQVITAYLPTDVEANLTHPIACANQSPPQRCPQEFCSLGDPIARTCPGVSPVCNRDSYCCRYGWDDQCAQAARALGLKCAG